MVIHFTLGIFCLFNRFSIFCSLQIYDSKYWKYSILLLMLWFSAVVLTFSKGLIMSVIFFCASLLLKGKEDLCLIL